MEGKLKQKSIYGTKVLSVRLPEKTIDRLRYYKKIYKKKYRGQLEQNITYAKIVDTAINEYIDRESKLLFGKLRKG
jgi:hypothetical protein